jgi:hypothetical protein
MVGKMSRLRERMQQLLEDEAVSCRESRARTRSHTRSRLRCSRSGTRPEHRRRTDGARSGYVRHSWAWTPRSLASRLALAHRVPS